MIGAEAVRLYVGGDASTVQRRRCHLTGYRCFSGAYGPVSRFPAARVPEIVGLLDSGAFTDVRGDKRLGSPDLALARQLAWERNAERFWQSPYVSEALVSYDLLIDEKWTGQRRKKQRFGIAEADRAVRVTVDAAAYLASRRQELLPRRLVLACQGVDAIQYEECAAGVLGHAGSGDVFGLGGWCILGCSRTWIPTFWAAMRRVLPRVAAAGLGRVHLFGVLYRPVLGPLLWLCDRLGLALSVDSSGPILGPCWKDQKRAGVLAPLWEDNVRLWQEALTGLRDSLFYREPPDPRVSRQLDLWEEEIRK